MAGLKTFSIMLVIVLLLVFGVNWLVLGKTIVKSSTDTVLNFDDSFSDYLKYYETFKGNVWVHLFIVILFVSIYMLIYLVVNKMFEAGFVLSFIITTGLIMLLHGINFVLIEKQVLSMLGLIKILPYSGLVTLMLPFINIEGMVDKLVSLAKQSAIDTANNVTDNMTITLDLR